MITKNQLGQISAFAIDLDWNRSFAGKSRGNRHLFRMVDHALDLAKTLHADQSIVEAGAWLHDTNLEKTISGDTLANADKVRAFLHRINVEKEDIDRVLHCIAAHDGRIPATTTEAMIIHDADTLEKMGPLGVIRETWKKSQEGWTTERICNHLPQHLAKRQKNLYTEKARKDAAALMQTLESFFAVLALQVMEKKTTCSH